MPAMAAPLYTSMEGYPIGPIHHFPPPLPARQSLRSRCGVTMRLQLSTLGLTGPLPGWSPKGHVQPHRNNLPRRRNAKRVALHDPDEDEPKAVVVVETVTVVEVAKRQEEPVLAAVHVQPHRNNLPRRRNVRRVVINDTDEDNVLPLAPPRAALVQSKNTQSPVPSHPPIEEPFIPAISSNDSHLQLLVPGIFMAFAGCDTQPDQLPRQSTADPYTHVIRVVYGDDAAIERVTERGTQSLYLRLPSALRDSCAARAGLGLTSAQLHAAQDFMAEAQPHLDLAQEISSGIRLLVAGPHGRPTDVMCVAACYFSSVTGKSMEDVLRFIDAEDDILSVWKGEVSDDEAEKVENVARACS